MKISILPFFVLLLFAFIVLITRRARHNRSITGEEAQSLYTLISALAMWTLVSTSLGLAGLHTSPWLLQTVPLLWQAILPVVIVMTPFLFSKRLRSALLGVAVSTPVVWLVFVQALRVGALGGMVKGIRGEVTSGFVFWVGIPDFLFGLSAIAVGWLLLRGFVGPRFLMVWSLTGAAVILVPTFAFMSHWMNEPGFIFIFQFPMVLAPSIVVPIFIFLNSLLAWRSFRFSSQGAPVGLPESARVSTEQPPEGDFFHKYGPWALITGASSGIGSELAKEIAALGLNVVLVARRRDRLESIGDEIENRFNVKVKVVVADLTQEQGINTVKRETDNVEIGLLVNNAGREDSGFFLETPVDQLLTTLDLNTRAPLQLTHHFAKKLVQNGQGGIIFLSSIVAFQGVPLISNYAATKAYDLILSESLAAELASSGIDVLAVAPGFTDTKLSSALDFRGIPIKPIEPSAVARQAIRQLGRKRLTVPGIVNGFLYIASKYLQPRRLNTFQFGTVFRHVLRKKIPSQLNT